MRSPLATLMRRTAVVLWLVAHGGLGATEVSTDWIIDNVRRTEPTRGSVRIEIRNLFGDLRIRPSDQDEIYLSAMLQRHSEDPLRAEIVTGPVDGTYRIEVTYPPPEGGELVADLPEWQKRRVDLTVFVPAKRPIRLETDRGLLEVKGLEHGIEAWSAHGNITVSTGGPLIARTGRGSITCRFSATDWQRPVELETLTGPIAVTLPADANTTVTMETFGELTTDYSLTVSRPNRQTPKTAQAAIGKGERELFMTSNRGNLKLVREPF
jgi:hypothetical protein